MREHEWFAEHSAELAEKYPGKYIAIVNEEIAAIGDEPKKVDEEARKKYPESIPLVVYLPKKSELELLIL